LAIILLLIFEMPIISNAAAINDDSFISHNNKNKEFANIKNNMIHVFNGNFDKATSEYNIELLLAFKKSEMIKNIEGKPLNNKKYYLTDSGISNFFQIISNDEIDGQMLLETEMVWEEIKGGLKDKKIFVDKINGWTQDILDKYLDENTDTDFLLVSDINSIKQSTNKNDFYKPKNMPSSIIYQEETDRINQNDDKLKILSINYLWEKYSDVIVGVLIFAILWRGIVNLMKFLTKISGGRY
jgi:hypothetical protein